MVQRYTEDFSVVWHDPADAQRSWVLDAMHFPRPAPPLTARVIGRMYEEIFNARSIFVNGYLYLLDAAPPPPTPEVIERGVFNVWDKEYVPRIADACQRLRTTDYDGMSAVQLADSLEEIIGDAMDAFRYTMVVVFAFMLPTMQLVDFCEKQLGPEGPQLLATLLQGSKNGTAAAGAGLAELAELAAGLPDVADALRQGRHKDLESVAGGGQFSAGLHGYLNEYGWRVESWGLAHVPTWAEDPATPLMLISRYLSDPNLSPAASIKRSHEQRQEALCEMESKLDGERLAEFKSRLAACEGHVPISEGRALWQLTIIGSLRVPLLALGRKLVEAGALDEPNDVFFLNVEELKEAARNPSALVRKTARARKADLERWEGLNPPPFVGVAPAMGDAPPEVQIVQRKFFGLGVEPSTDKNVVKGNPASRGVVRGRARVIRELSKADRLQKGEVLVCPTTAPPWTPLFAIAAAIVTDTGGILSHSAICAREYGIPCVVGTQVGTQQIPDGAMVTVDGAEGIVRIEV